MNLIKKRRGFAVGELLLFLILLGTLTALLAQPFIRAKEKATQKSTMADIEMWGEAISCYVSDNSVAPTNPRGTMSYKKPIIKELAPYLKAIRIVDWWGNPLLIWTGKGVKQYGIITQAEKEFIISSPGRKGIMEGWKYDPKNLSSGFFETRKLEDFEKDLVMWNNTFIRCPR